MKALPVLILLLSISALAEPSSSRERDLALQKINACLEHNDASSRSCKGLNANIQVLVDTYNTGDKSVLPTLFKFPNLTEFFDDAIIADPASFLTSLSLLPEKDQRAVATGIAGGMFGLRSKDRVERVTATLSDIPESQPVWSVAQLCLEEVKQRNALFVISYFPPETFTGTAGDFTLRMYSSGMFALGERPIWRTSATNESVYRLTYLPSFGNATVVSLTLMSDGGGIIAIKSVDRDRKIVTTDRTSAVPTDSVIQFLRALDQMHFWQASTELPATAGELRTDGAEWILEGAKNGEYRVVVRRPHSEGQNGDEMRFVDSGILLSKLAGCNHPGSCA